MALFFDTCVEGNYRHLIDLLEYIAHHLEAGDTVTLTVSGYASPLYTDKYNRVLSRRRIEAFVNTVRTWHNGALALALADGRLQIHRLPQGIDTRPSAMPSGDPVYSLRAAMSRRIEIVDCRIK